MTASAAKPRRHALSGNGPIVDRARSALRHVAREFGDITRTTQTTVEVLASDGIELTLSYDPGNYIFSRVYNLTISAELPVGTLAPEAKLSHRGKAGTHYMSVDGKETPALQHLNQIAGPYLTGIDVHSSRITGTAGARTFTVTPLGGAYVWVLIPPVFKATAFPKNEPERILDLIRAVRHIGSSTAS